MPDTSNITLKTLLEDAYNELEGKALRGEPLVVSYKAPCPCGQPPCKLHYSITITPYVAVVHNTLRNFQ